MLNKKKYAHNFDEIFWFVIYLLPFIFYTCYILGDFFTTGVTTSTLSPAGFWRSSQFSFEFLTGILSPLFADSSFRIFNATAWTNPLWYYFGYLLVVYLVHLFIDFLLLLPRLVRKLFDSFWG